MASGLATPVLFAGRKGDNHRTQGPLHRLHGGIPIGQIAQFRALCETGMPGCFADWKIPLGASGKGVQKSILDGAGVGGQKESPCTCCILDAWAVAFGNRADACQMNTRSAIHAAFSMRFKENGSRPRPGGRLRQWPAFSTGLQMTGKQAPIARLTGVWPKAMAGNWYVV